MKTDRFKLEERIMRAWTTSDDLEDFILQFYERQKRMTDDEVFNVVWGLKELHDIRMEQLMDVFKRVFQLDEYSQKASEFFNHSNKEGECND